MLQIIGWLGCLYLVVKGLEIFAQKPDDADTARVIAVTLSWLGAVAFAILIYMQGNEARSIMTDLDANVPDTIQVDVN